MGNMWIIDVIADLKTFADQNDLPRPAGQRAGRGGPDAGQGRSNAALRDPAFLWRLWRADGADLSPDRGFAPAFGRGQIRPFVDQRGALDL